MPPHSLEIELDGQSDPKIINQVLSNIDAGNLNCISVTLESDEPLQSVSDERQQVVQGDGRTASQSSTTTETSSEPKSAPSISDDQREEPKTSEDPCPENIPEIGPNASRRKLLTVMDQHDTFLPSSKIKNNVPNRYGVKDSRVSKLLYQMGENGLVEKKEADHIDQKRGNAKYVYKITTKGRKTLERATENHGELEA